MRSLLKNDNKFCFKVKFADIRASQDKSKKMVQKDELENMIISLSKLKKCADARQRGLEHNESLLFSDKLAEGPSLNFLTASSTKNRGRNYHKSPDRSPVAARVANPAAATGFRLSLTQLDEPVPAKVEDPDVPLLKIKV